MQKAHRLRSIAVSKQSDRRIAAPATPKSSDIDAVLLQ
jgi:hypothetical protein